jgi:hypothetical protein
VLEAAVNETLERESKPTIQTRMASKKIIDCNIIIETESLTPSIDQNLQ